MIEKPPIEEGLIRTRLEVEYGLDVGRIDFLPLGVDVHSAVYRVRTADGGDCFLKLRSAPFKEKSILIPNFLVEQGIRPIIPSIGTLQGTDWGSLGDYRMILFPYIQGQDGYHRSLSQANWLEFGSSLAAIHAVRLPPRLHASLPREEFSPQWRESLRDYQALVEERDFHDSVAAALAAFMRSRREEIDQVRGRAGELAEVLGSRPANTVLCHSDLHPGNFLVADDGMFFIVDWDEAVLAPRERDLMFIGATGNPTGEDEQGSFYRGYGPAGVDRAALAYYRYERIVQDLAAFCAQLLLTDEGGRDRLQGLEYFKSNFVPGGEIDIARNTDRPA